MRTFLAFPVNDRIRSLVASLQRHLGKKLELSGKWTTPANLHLTVLFLGQQEQNALDRLAERLRGPRPANMVPFTLFSGEAGTFGRPPRLIYLGWDEAGSRQFAELAHWVKQQAVETEMGISRSDIERKSIPHLTLLRFRHRKQSRKLREVADIHRGRIQWHAPLPLPDPPEQLVCRELVLYQSILRPDGPEYRELERFPLKD